VPVKRDHPAIGAVGEVRVEDEAVRADETHSAVAEYTPSNLKP
jgi:hypothetical protein